MPSAYYWNVMAENTENPKCGCGHRLDEHSDAEACTNKDDECTCSEFHHEEPYAAYTKGYNEGFERAAAIARDRMVQQAQPLTDEHHCWLHETSGKIEKCSGTCFNNGACRAYNAGITRRIISKSGGQ